MTTNGYAIGLGLAIFMSAVPGGHAQQKSQLSGDYPTKPVRIVTADPGGGQDFAARLFAQGLAGPLGQTVIVDNRAPLISYELVAKAPADGYTLLLAGSPFWVVPLL